MKTVATRPPCTTDRSAATSFMDTPLLSPAPPWQPTATAVGLCTRRVGREVVHAGTGAGFLLRAPARDRARTRMLGERRCPEEAGRHSARSTPRARASSDQPPEDPRGPCELRLRLPCLRGQLRDAQHARL